MTMDVAGALEQAWEPSAPGAGALRATAIAQLYFRMTSHHPLTILVVDAMCLVFGADGVTVQELVNYLGITEDRVRFGLEGVPVGMRCTARQLESEESLLGTSPGAIDDDRVVQRDRRIDTEGEGTKETRYYLNYKRMLPLVYAHVTRLLLSACVTDLPSCRYVESVKQSQLAVYQKSDASTAHAFFASGHPPHAHETPATSGGAGLSGRDIGDSFDVSESMRRRSAIRGVPCMGCSCYFLPEEFRDTLTRCPQCGKDSLSLCLNLIQTHLQARLGEHQTLATLLPPVRQVWKRVIARGVSQASNAGQTSTLSGAGTPQTTVQHSATGTGSVATPPISPLGHLVDCTLARDPFLFQQAIAFMWLYSTRFASVNDAASVVDVQEILTESEYQHRLRSRVSVADQFRSHHRHAASVHVRLISQQEIDAARQHESHQKLMKRRMLPPWLRHTTVLDELGGSHIYACPNTGAAMTGQEEMNVVKEPWEMEDSRFEETNSGQAPAAGAVWTAQSNVAGSSMTATSAQKRRRVTTDADVKAELTRTASFIAAQYYNDEFDAVLLPQWRRVREKAKS